MVTLQITPGIDFWGVIHIWPYFLIFAIASFTYWVLYSMDCSFKKYHVHDLLTLAVNSCKALSVLKGI